MMNGPNARTVEEPQGGVVKSKRSLVIDMVELCRNPGAVPAVPVNEVKKTAGIRNVHGMANQIAVLVMTAPAMMTKPKGSCRLSSVIFK